VSRASWPNAVKQLRDRLVDMGFEDSEADAFIEKVPQLGLNGGAGNPLFAEAPPPTILELAKVFNSSHAAQAAGTTSNRAKARFPLPREAGLGHRRQRGRAGAHRS
jgi:hypothetical protein